MSSYALITGASKGIGRQMAICLAKRKHNLLLAARSAEELNDLKKELQPAYNISVETLSIDLSQQGSSNELFKWITSNSWRVNVLINNAGYGIWGNFGDLLLAEQMNMVQLNVNTLIELSHMMLPALNKEKESYILNVASTAAYQAVPTLALYSASKAFVLSFSRALRFELKDTNTSVTCICPGPVDTGFASRAGLDALSKLAQTFNMKPEIVAEIAIRGMFNKKSEIIPGFTNVISAYAARLLPKGFIERTAAGIYK
jgi:uncharacterized protein